MLTLNLACNVLPDRVVTIQLPPTVQPGQHELVIVLDQASDVNLPTDAGISNLMQFSGSVALYKNMDGMAYQREIRSEWN
jgi:hypothetical protein